MRLPRGVFDLHVHRKSEGLPATDPRNVLIAIWLTQLINLHDIYNNKHDI